MGMRLVSLRVLTLVGERERGRKRVEIGLEIESPLSPVVFFLSLYDAPVVNFQYFLAD